MQLEKVQYTATARTTGAFGLLSQFLVALLAAMMVLAPTATVLAQQPAQNTERTQSVAASTKTQKGTAMTQPGSVRSTDANAIRPFHVNFPKAALDDLRRRIAATRWPEQETVTDQSQGVQLATMKKLVSYWQTDYDWRKVEAKLNSLPQFITAIIQDCLL